MKTLQEMYEEIKKSDDLKKALAEAVKAEKVTDFLKAHDCDATFDELKEFVAEKAAQDSKLELSEDELEKVAGGQFIMTCDCNEMRRGHPGTGNCTNCNCR